MKAYLKRGDTSPGLRLRVIDEQGQALDLTGASAVFNMRDQAGTVIVNRAPAMIEGPEIVRYDWTPADTAAAGRMLAEIEITWPDGRRETAPNAGWIEVLISQDIA